MKKSTFEQIGGTYHQESGYFLPDLFPPESISVGIWGQRRRHYLKTQHRPAETMFFQLVKQLAEREGITEQLKAEDQMEWVRQMNSVRNRAEEVIYNELIHA